MRTSHPGTMRKRFISGCGVALVATVAILFQQTLAVKAAPSTLVTAVTVPWQGIPSQSHVIGDTAGLTTIFVQGVSYAAGTSDYTCTGIAPNGVTWDFGDGSAVYTTSCSNPANLGVSHTYPVAAAGTPYTATLTLTDTSGNTSSATFRIQVQPKSIDLEANMAIDRGLWWLHTQMTRTTSGSPAVKVGSWNNSTLVSATATAVNAMEVNNHLPSGNALTNPYVDDVQRGLAYLTTRLSAQAIGNQPSVNENPDTNGNGIGLYPSGDNSVNYINGMVQSAFVSSGTPNAIAPLGVVGSPVANGVKGRTYKDLVQDMQDYNNWSQLGPENGFGVADTGSWYYTANTGIADTSVAQWPAIGSIAARDGFGIVTPQWVLDRANAWLLNCQRAGGTADGAYDYNCRNSVQSNYSADTPAGMIMGEMTGWLNDAAALTTNEVRFQRAVSFITRDWTCLGGYGCRTYNGSANFYAYFALTKAFRLAKPQVLTLKYPTGHLLAGQTFDWYANDPTAAQQTAGHAIGMARMVLRNQSAAGNFNSSQWVGNSHLATAMGIIILSPAVFEVGPTAKCSVDATITCSAGATCGAANVGEYSQVNFDGSQSVHNDPAGTIASWVWNFQDGSPNVSNVTAAHSFTPASTPATFNVQLTVTDTKGHTSSATCPVTVVSTALPPIVDPGGPYVACQDRNDDLTLDGSGSFGRGSNISAYAWDWTSPVNFASADASSITATWTAAYIDSLTPGTYDVGLQVLDDSSAHFVTSKFTTVTVRADCAPPVITVPANISVITPNTSAPVSFVVTATDSIDPSVLPICSSAPTVGLVSGSNFPVGTTTITCNATDDSGNQAAPASFTITVSNNTPPTFSAPDLTATATSPDGAVVNYTVSGTDSEDGANLAAPVCSPASGSQFPIGSTTVTCTVTDAGGLTATGSFTVTVTNTPPTVTVPADITTEATSPAGATVTYTATGNDAEQGAIEPVCAPASGSTFALGTTSVTCTVTDVAGASASASFNVTVQDTTPPVITVPTPITVHATGPSGAAVSYVTSATDIVDVTDAVTCSPASGATFPLGTTTVECTSTDAHGNTSTASFTVTVTNVAPVCQVNRPMQILWPPNHQLVSINPLVAVTDADGDPITIKVLSIRQDELTNDTGDGNTAIDGYGVGTGIAQVRAERTGNVKNPGNGRVYYISYTATDNVGASCTGTITAGVPHDQGGKSTPIGDGPLHDSTVASAPPAAAIKKLF